MSIFEWIGESHNPGPVGDVEVGGRSRRERSPGTVLACAAIAAALLGLWAYVLFGVAHAGLLAGALGTVLYPVLGYLVHPHADLSNVGWLGGMIDHPFRYSDDLNRLLLFLTVVLWPGRLVAESFVDMGRLLARGWRSGARRGHRPGRR